MKEVEYTLSTGKYVRFEELLTSLDDLCNYFSVEYFDKDSETGYNNESDMRAKYFNDMLMDGEYYSFDIDSNFNIVRDSTKDKSLKVNEYGRLYVFGIEQFDCLKQAGKALKALKAGRDSMVYDVTIGDEDDGDYAWHSFLTLDDLSPLREDLTEEEIKELKNLI